LAIVIFCMPTAIPVTPTSMSIARKRRILTWLDYASVVFASFTTISAVWYFVWGRKNFTGPVMHVRGPDGEIKEVDAKPINQQGDSAVDDNMSEKTAHEGDTPSVE
jgi:hypothetical protein